MEQNNIFRVGLAIREALADNFVRQNSNKRHAALRKAAYHLFDSLSAPAVRKPPGHSIGKQP